MIKTRERLEESLFQKSRAMGPPWGPLLRSPAVWAIVVNNFTFHYAFYVVMNWLPTYFDRVRARPALPAVSCV